MLDELILGGEIQETSKKNVLKAISAQDLLQEVNYVYVQGVKKIIFTACHSGKLKLAFTSPDVISTSPKNFLTS